MTVQGTLTLGRIAARDLRGGLGGFAVFLVSLALGVAAIVAVGTINLGVQDTVARDARTLLGGDLVIQSANIPLGEDEIRALVPQAERLTLVTRSTTLAESVAGRRVAVSLKAVGDEWPLYGSVELDPPLPIDEALADGGAVAEAALLARLGVGLGDRIRIGAVEVTLRATILREPDRLGGMFAFGPRLIVTQTTLDRAGILAPGALAEFSWRLGLRPGTDPVTLARTLEASRADARWQVREPTDVQARVARFTDRLGTYLTLAGMTALLTGGVGIGLAIDGYLRARQDTIATMKSLGAASTQIFTIYLLQVCALVLTGVAGGVVLGLVLPLLLHLLPAGLLPVTPRIGVYAAPIALAAAAGLLTAVVFAMFPLAAARDVSPAALFRQLVDPPRHRRRGSDVAVVVLALALLAVLAVATAPQLGLALWFVGIVAVAALILAATAAGLLRVLARVEGYLPPRLRLPCANLHRPGSGAAAVIVAIGAGLAVLTAIGILQSNLTREIASRTAQRAPSHILIDIQPDQVAELREIVAATPGARLVQEAPMLRARIVRIAGVPVEQARVAEHVAWTLERDRGLSYAAELPPGSELSAGSWWPADYAGPALVSVEDEVALGYGVEVGDTLAFNILGRVVEARIANLRREIDWGSGRLDFVFILSPGVLEGAPHTWIAAAEVPAEASASFVDRIAARLANVTPVEVRQVVQQVEDTLGKIALAIRTVAAVTLVSGALVLAGAVGAARQRHRYQAVMLKVLGARRREVVTLFLAEYAVLGAAAALIGVLIGSLAAYGVVWWFFGMVFYPAPATVAVIVALALTLCLAAGVVGLLRTLGQSAAAVLRSA